MINTDSELLYFVTNEASVFYQLLPMDAVKKKLIQAELGVPRSEIQVEPD